MSDNASESEYKRIKRSCCVVFDYVLFAFLHCMGAYYVYGLICYHDAMDNQEFANSTMVETIDPDYYTTMICCMYSMLLLFMIYALKQYTRHAVGVCLSCSVLSSALLTALVGRMILNSCKYRPLLTCQSSADGHVLSDEALSAAFETLGMVCASLVCTQLLFVVGSMVKNKQDRLYYFSEDTCIEFLKIEGFYYGSAVVLAALPVIISAAISCIVCGAGENGGCDTSNSGTFNLSGIAYGHRSSAPRSDEENDEHIV
jgi:hypothetical protein